MINVICNVFEIAAGILLAAAILTNKHTMKWVVKNLYKAMNEAADELENERVEDDLYI